MSFNYDMGYHPGSQNAPADCLSCLPLTVSPPGDTVIPAPLGDAEEEFVAACKSLSVADVTDACASCSELTKLRTQITKGWPPSPKGLETDLLPYHRLPLEMSVRDNSNFRGDLLIAPATLRPVLVSGSQRSPLLSRVSA